MMRLKHTHSSDSPPPVHAACAVEGRNRNYTLLSHILLDCVSLSLSPTDPLSSEQCVR